MTEEKTGYDRFKEKAEEMKGGVPADDKEETQEIVDSMRKEAEPEPSLTDIDPASDTKVVEAEQIDKLKEAVVETVPAEETTDIELLPQEKVNILTWDNDEEKARKLGLIKRTVAKNATDDELAMFVYQAKKTGLDPLAKQIYFVKRNSKTGPVVTIQTGIDGYRAVAERTGELAGISDATFDSEEGKQPKKATVTVSRLLKNGDKSEFTATARWEEYAVTGGQGFMWNKMPYLMLSKCAEALALRKAFPHDLSGIYTQEEMQQANQPDKKQITEKTNAAN